MGKEGRRKQTKGWICRTSKRIKGEREEGINSPSHCETRDTETEDVNDTEKHAGATKQYMIDRQIGVDREQELE